jgi:hypothetical protein
VDSSGSADAVESGMRHILGHDRSQLLLKAYPCASGATISGGEKRRLMIEHIENLSSPGDPTCPIFRAL